MAPTLIMLLIAVLAIGLVVWLIRRKSGRTYAQSLEQDTAWNDTLTDNRPKSAPPPLSSADQEPRP